VKKLDGDKLFAARDSKGTSDLDGSPVMSECWQSNAILVSSLQLRPLALIAQHQTRCQLFIGVM
jgi:hypothetical protein